LAIIITAGIVIRQQTSQTPQDLPQLGESPRWQTRADLPTARSGLAVVAHENQILAIAGETLQGPTGVVERYDPEADSWTEGATKPTAVWDSEGAVIGGKIYVPGGRLGSGSVVDVLEIYDPRLDQWTQGAPLPVALSAYAMAAYEGKLYVFGGWDGQNYLNSVYEYNPEENVWNEKTAMPTARAFAGAAVTGGKIFLIGGFDGKRALRVNETYQPDLEGTSDPWGKAASLPTGRYSMGVTSVADIIQVVGGITDEEGPSIALEYFPQSDTWVEFGSLGDQVLTDLGVVSLGTQLYVVGGKMNDAPTDQNLSYQAVFILSIPVVR
jgi:N-acetylneuraminic acid mutarotase